LLQHGSDSWIEFDFKGADTTLVGVGIKSANDCPSRDPETIVISVPADPQSKEWIVHHTIQVDFPSVENKRWHEIQFVIPEVTTTKMRFDCHNPKDRCTQLGQILFYGEK